MYSLVAHRTLETLIASFLRQDPNSLRELQIIKVSMRIRIFGNLNNQVDPGKQVNILVETSFINIFALFFFYIFISFVALSFV